MTINIVGGIKVPAGSGTGTLSTNSRPVFTTPEGSIGSVLEPDTITSQGFSIEATDPDDNDTVSYSIFSGTLPRSSAHGTITFTGQPNASDTVVINTVTWTFVASGATGNQANIGATLSDTLSNLVTVLDASVDGLLTLATYSSTDTILNITYNNTSAAGNSFALSAGTDTAGVQTASAATLEGGNVEASINASTGAITGGTIYVVGSTVFTFTVRITDGKLVEDREFSIQVNDGDDPIWQTPAGTLGAIFLGGEAVSESIAALDPDSAPAPLAYSVIAGALPTDLSLNSSTGEISGTAVAGSTSTFTIEATDTLNASSRAFTIRVNAPPVFTTSGDIGSVSEGASDSFAVNATTGVDLLTQIVSYTLDSGTLPTGYSLNETTGAITGTAGPTAAGVFNFTIQASDGLETADQAHSITIVENVQPIWVTDTGNLEQSHASRDGIYKGGESVLETVLATDGDSSPVGITYSVTTGLAGFTAAGLSLNSSNGDITGTAVANATTTFTIEATDSIDTVGRSFTIRINNPPIFTTTGSLGSVKEGANDSFAVNATHGDTISLGQTVTYAMQGGSLPPNYSLNTSTGAITGTAGTTDAGVYNFTIRANDGLETTDQGHSITISNNLVPAWDTPSGTFGTQASEGASGSTYTVNATDPDGSPAAITYSLTGSLPTGMSLNASTGVISGTPTDDTFSDDVRFPFTINASDTIDSAPRGFAIDVNCSTFEAGTGTSATGRDQNNTTSLVNALNLVYGRGTGGTGFGQGDFSTPILNSEVSTTDLLNWREAVADCAAHQGITLSPPLPSAGTFSGGKPWLGAEAYFNTLLQNINNGSPDISDNPTANNGSSYNVTSGGVALTETRTATWSGTVDHQFTATFADSDHARAFFNSGGQIKLTASKTLGNATAQDTSWTNMLLGAGQFTFRNIDYFALTTGFVTFDSVTAGAGVYSANDWTVAAKTNTVGSPRGGKGYIITFRSQFNDDHTGVVGTPTGQDVVTGNLTSFVDTRNVDGSDLTIALPTFSTTNPL